MTVIGIRDMQRVAMFPDSGTHPTRDITNLRDVSDRVHPSRSY